MKKIAPWLSTVMIICLIPVYVKAQQLDLIYPEDSVQQPSIEMFDFEKIFENFQVEDFLNNLDIDALFDQIDALDLPDELTNPFSESELDNFLLKLDTIPWEEHLDFLNDQFSQQFNGKSIDDLIEDFKNLLNNDELLRGLEDLIENQNDSKSKIRI